MLFCDTFTGCDTVSSIAGHQKSALFNKFWAGDIDEHMEVFLNIHITKTQ